MGKKGTKRKTRWRVLPIGDDGSEDEESRDDDRGGRERHWKPRSRFHHHQGQGTYGTYGTYGSGASGQEKRTFNEDEYTRITTPRQDVLFKKGYLGRKRATAEASPAAATSNGTNGNYNHPVGSTNGDGSLHNGESVDAEGGDGSDMMDDPAFYYPGPFVEPPGGMYYVNGSSYEMYDPTTGVVTVVVGPGPGLVGLPPMGLPPLEWFNPRLPPPPHGPPPHMGPPHMQSDYCYMHGRKRYSVDSSQNCSGPSSESAGSGPPSGPPSSPQDCDSGGPPSGASPGPSPGPPPIPPMGPMPYPHHPYMYPYMFGAPLYSLDGVSVHGGPPYGGPICDVNAVNKRRKKKRKRKKRRGGTDDGSEESSSEDNQLEEAEGAGPSSLSSQSVEDSSLASTQATPTDSDAAFPEFVPRSTSTLNGNASVWEPSVLTPPQTPTAAPIVCQISEAVCSLDPTPEVAPATAAEACSQSADESTKAEEVQAAQHAPATPTEVLPTSAPVDDRVTPEESPVSSSVPPATPAETAPTAAPIQASLPATVLAQAPEVPVVDSQTQSSAAEASVQTIETPVEVLPAPCDDATTDVKATDASPKATPVLEVAPQGALPGASVGCVSEKPPPAASIVEEPVKCVEINGSRINGEVICVSKKTVEESSVPLVNGKLKAPRKEARELQTSLTLPVEKVKVPVCNGQVICLTEAVKCDSQGKALCFEVSGDSVKDSSEPRTEKESIEVFLNHKNESKQKGKHIQTKSIVNEGVAKGGGKNVNASNDKIKKTNKNNNSSPENGFAEKTRFSASPSRDAVPEEVTVRNSGEREAGAAQSKREPASKTKGSSGKRKASKKGAKTDLSSNAGGSNGVMAQTPTPSPQTPAPDPTPPGDGFSLSLRPESSMSWGRRAEEAKVPAVDDVLLQALVGATPGAEGKADIPVDSEPAPDTTVGARLDLGVKPEATTLAGTEAQPEVQSEKQPDEQQEDQNAEHRLTPSPVHRPNRPKKWRQNTKERAPTPGRELTLSSSDESDDVETVLFESPRVAAANNASQEEGERTSPLRITEAVTAWLRDHEQEEVLVPAVAHVSDTEDTVDTDEDEEEDEDEDEKVQQPKNALGNPFRASSHSSTTRAGMGSGTDVEERVASLDEPELEAAWDTLCDPSLFVAKYYRLGDDPHETMATLPPVLALELRPNGSRPSLEKRSAHDREQQDSGVHTDESGDEHQTPTKDTLSAQAQAEELAAKSAYLLRQLKGQSPGVPCGGICCTLQ